MYDWDKVWDHLYATFRCPDVLIYETSTLTFIGDPVRANEDACRLLSMMDNEKRNHLFARYINRYPTVREELEEAV